MIRNGWIEDQREFLQNELFSRGIFKINGRHLYECSLAEMNQELCYNKEGQIAYIRADEKKE